MVCENYVSVEILSRDIFISVQAYTHSFSSRVGCWVDPTAMCNLCLILTLCLNIPCFLFHISKYQHTSHQLVSVADFGQSVNHIKHSISCVISGICCKVDENCDLLGYIIDGHLTQCSYTDYICYVHTSRSHQTVNQYCQ